MIRSILRGFSYKLFTPGPLSTTASVKLAMAEDTGTSSAFFTLTNDVRSELLKISGLPSTKYTSILLPGSGTFGVETTIRTAVSTSDKILIAANGAYGERMIKMCRILGIPHKAIQYDEREKVRINDVLEHLTEDVTHFAMVHSETTTGILNDISQVAKAVKERSGKVVVIGDCVSSFGAVDADFSNLDFIVTCSNKLLQGVPGLALVIAKTQVLDACEGKARSAYLDLVRIAKEKNHFLCMPPYQSVLGLKKAIEEFWEEGGVQQRQARYQRNQIVLKEEMERLGFRLYIDPKDQGWIISTFVEPKHPNYSFKELYGYLVSKNVVIYPGKLSKLPTFRIGTIGELYEKDMRECIKYIIEAFEHMKVPLPLV